MISEWKAELEKHGFIYKTWSPRERAYVKYIDNVLEHQIWEDRTRQDKGKRVINTFISVHDPFVDKETHGFHVVLGGRLADDRVVIPRSDTGVGRSWGKEEGTEALHTLLNYGLPWLDVNSSLETLIQHLENDVVVRPTNDKNSTQCTWLFSHLFRKRQQQAEVKIRPINRLLLSLLYYHSGDTGQACEHAKEWLIFVQRGGMNPGEPDRTFRQLEKMGCTGIETE